MVSQGLDGDLTRSSLTKYMPFDDLSLEFIKRPGALSGKTINIVESIDSDILRKSIYYNEFFKAIGTATAMSVVVNVPTSDRTPFTLLSVIWRSSDPVFEQERADRLVALRAHLQRAGRMMFQIMPDFELEPTLGAAVDAYGAAALLIGLDRKILYASAAAEPWLTPRSGLAIRAGRLVATGTSDHRRLSDALDLALGRHKLRVPSELVIMGDDGALLPVKIWPLGVDNPFEGFLQPARALVLLLASPAATAGGRDRLQELFGLTLAEAEIAAELIRGRRPTEIALARRRSVLTIRTQIRAILGKMNCQRVSDLAILSPLLS